MSRTDDLLERCNHLLNRYRVLEANSLFVEHDIPGKDILRTYFNAIKERRQAHDYETAHDLLRDCTKMMLDHHAIRNRRYI